MMWLCAWMLSCVRGSGVDSGSQIPGDLLSVSESASGRLLFLDPSDGRYKGELCLSEILPDTCPPSSEADETNQCLLFASEHRLEDDQSTFWLTYSRRDPDVSYAPAGIVSVTATHPPTVRWKLDTLVFPDGTTEANACPDAGFPSCFLNGTHILTEDQDGVLIAADTNNSRILWIEPSADGSGAVIASLPPIGEQWEEWRNVNHVQVLHDGDRTLLLSTFKARQTDEGLSDQGQLVMWDVTDRQSPNQLWAWPKDGYLAAVHHGIVQDTAEGKLLIYAHSLGASEDPDDGLYGSVGLARYNGPDEPPTYLADAVLDADEHPLGFVREAEVFAPGDWLLITDSGCENSASECDLPGRLLSVQLPSLDAAMVSGRHGDQHFVSLEPIPDAQRHQLTFPYDADLFYLDEIDQGLVDGIGGCPTEAE